LTHHARISVENSFWAFYLGEACFGLVKFIEWGVKGLLNQSLRYVSGLMVGKGLLSFMRGSVERVLKLQTGVVDGEA